MTRQGGRGAQRPGIAATVAQPDRRTSAAAGLAGWLAAAAPARARGVVSIALVSDRRMRVLNRTFRAADYATDVLSFPADRRSARDTGGGKRPGSKRHAGQTGSRGALAAGAERRTGDLGEIVIALGVARRQAAEYGHSLGVELKILALHGLLHLLGYDHERDRGAMHAVEDRLRRRAGLPAGLIARAGRTVQE